MTSELGGPLDEIIDSYLAAHPLHAVSLGLHDYDGRVPDYQHVDDRIRTLRSHRRRLMQITLPYSSTQAGLDYHLVASQVQRELFELEVRRAHALNPMHYVDDLDVSVYLKRSYAPLGVRAAAVQAHLEQIPRILEQARKQLQPPFPAPWLDMARRLYQGTLTFLRQDLVETMLPLYGSRQARALSTALETATAALQRWLAWLHELVPGPEAAYALGEAPFRQMLATAEQVDWPLDDLIRQGQADLDRNLARIREVAARIDPQATVQEVMHRAAQDHPSARTLVQETSDLLESIRQFVVERDLVSIPSAERCEVRETPGFLRWAFAFMDGAGPYEDGSRESFYYVTPPEPEWGAERSAAWLSKFEYGSLHVVSIHEAWPGHFLHNLHYHNAPTRATKVFGAYSFWEGWAHYAEEMMLEEGYGRDNPRIELAQLAEALVRNVRYMVAIGMHAQDMSVDEGVQRFMRDAFMEEETARAEAVRGTFDAAYGNYTLGKMLVRQLRERQQHKEGANFNLRRFHDRVLSYGAPPWKLVSDQMG